MSVTAHELTTIRPDTTTMKLSPFRKKYDHLLTFPPVEHQFGTRLEIDNGGGQLQHG